MKLRILFFLLFAFILTSFAQVKDYEIGVSPLSTKRTQGGLYDYSDPTSVNMKVAVWGFVRYPGRYIVPVETTVTDLFSYAGGPTEDANIDEVRLYRILADSTQYMLKVNYEDILWESSLESRRTYIPDLRAGDVLVVPGSQKLYFKDWFSITLSIVSTLLSIAILVLNIVNK